MFGAFKLLNRFSFGIPLIMITSLNGSSILAGQHVKLPVKLPTYPSQNTQVNARLLGRTPVVAPRAAQNAAKLPIYTPRTPAININKFPVVTPKVAQPKVAQPQIAPININKFPVVTPKVAQPNVAQPKIAPININRFPVVTPRVPAAHRR